jgi:type I restriction enzyme S subunit
LSDKFGIAKEHRNWIKKILNAYLPGVKIHVFGSRAHEDHKRYSDLDLAIETNGPIPNKTLMEIREQFTESSMPFKVDLVEYAKLDPEFKKNILNDWLEF